MSRLMKTTDAIVEIVLIKYDYGLIHVNKITQLVESVLTFLDANHPFWVEEITRQVVYIIKQRQTSTDEDQTL